MSGQLGVLVDGLSDAALILAFVPGPWTGFRYRNIRPLYGRAAQYPQMVDVPSTENVDESNCQNCLP